MKPVPGQSKRTPFAMGSERPIHRNDGGPVEPSAPTTGSASRGYEASRTTSPPASLSVPALPPFVAPPPPVPAPPVVAEPPAPVGPCALDVDDPARPPSAIPGLPSSVELHAAPHAATISHAAGIMRTSIFG